MLAACGGPGPLAQDEAADAKLARWGGTWLKPQKRSAVLNSARTTIGVRMQPGDIQFMRSCAKAALAARKEIQVAKKSLKTRVANDPDIQRVGRAIGVVPACVLWATVGNPQDYSCGEAYRKALGLNLTERSSGQSQGHLKISKRGPSVARR